MALNFFKQRDIDEIDVNDIPEEFINYLETLDEAGKIGLLASRPDIAKVLGVSVEDSNQDTVNTTDDSSEIVQEDERNPKSSAVFEEEQDIRNSVDVEPDVDEPEEVNEEFIAIQNNYYEGKRLAEILKDNMEPLEALAIPDKTDKCFIHRVLFKEKQIRYTGKGATYGVDMDILPENIRNMIGETMDNGFISVMYVDEVKGIEFDKVFVVSAAMHRNEKYIAYTRALSELIVVVDEKLMNNNSAKKVKENIEHNKKAGIHSAKMTGTLKWEKTKQPKAYTLEKTIDNDVITYHFTENTKSIIKNEFANTDSILPSSIASSPLTNIKKNIYAHCVYIENSICYNINCKENMGKKCNKEGNCDYYISLPVPPDEEELIAEDIDNAKKYLAKYS